MEGIHSIRHYQRATFDIWRVEGVFLFCSWAFTNYCVLSDNHIFSVLFTLITLTVYEYMGIFNVNNINRKKMIFLPILRKTSQSAGDVPCLHSVSLRWEQPIKSQFMTCNMKNSLYFLFFSFLPFCCIFSCCNFCFGSACHGRGRGENFSGGAGGGRGCIWFCCDLWFCGGQSALCLWVQWAVLSVCGRVVLVSLLWTVWVSRMFSFRMF